MVNFIVFITAPTAILEVVSPIRKTIFFTLRYPLKNLNIFVESECERCLKYSRCYLEKNSYCCLARVVFDTKNIMDFDPGVHI